MSSWLPLIFMALTSFWPLSKGGFQTPKTDSIPDLLLADEIDKAEALLNQQPRTAEAIAFRGEIEFRRGNFARAEDLYRESLRLSDGTAWAHFGLGKLALAKIQEDDAVSQFKRALDLAPKEAIFHWYASEAFGLKKSYTNEKTELQQYL